MSLGETLKEARESKGLSLDLVEEETKIRRKYLAALEEDEFGLLPGRVYVKAFLRTYARFLGLDGDELVARFEALHPEKREPAPESRPTVPVTGRRRAGPRSFLLVAGVIMLLVAFNAVYSSLRGGSPAPDLPPPGPRVEDNHNLPPAVQEPEPLPAEPPAVPEGLDLLLRITQENCWIRVVVDGGVAFEGILSAGESRNFQGRQAITLRLGNPGVVEARLNGEELGALGQRGVPVTHEFTVST